MLRITNSFSKRKNFWVQIKIGKNSLSFITISFGIALFTEFSLKGPFQDKGVRSGSDTKDMVLPSKTYNLVVEA